MLPYSGIWIHVLLAKCCPRINQFWLVGAQSVNITGISFQCSLRGYRFQDRRRIVLIDLNHGCWYQRLMAPVYLELLQDLGALSYSVLDCRDDPIFCPVVKMPDQIIISDRDRGFPGLGVDRYRFTFKSVIVSLVRALHMVVFSPFDHDPRDSALARSGNSQRQRHLRQRHYRPAHIIHSDRLLRQ